MSKPAEEKLEYWSGDGGRSTQQRRRVVLALEDEARPATAQDLYMKLRESAAQTKVSLATVYRTLKGLAEAGLADTFILETGETAYLCCAEGHHHHLTCRVCGKVVDLRDCDLSSWAEETARSHGFTGVEHRAELVGTCPSCRK